MKQTLYRIPAPLRAPCRIAVLADLHSHLPKGLLDTLKQLSPDLIAIPGDLIDCDTHRADHALLSRDAFDEILAFLRQAAAIAPVFYAPGNHDLLTRPLIHEVRAAGAFFLSDTFQSYGELTIGGLASGFGLSRQGHFKKTPTPDLLFLSRFEKTPGYHILLCHHPEYYPAYLKSTPIPLILSGHAHGGHWRLFGRGLFAPGQGFFPAYTSGVHDGRLVISRGMGDHTPIPRLFNPRELVIVELYPA